MKLNRILVLVALCTSTIVTLGQNDIQSSKQIKEPEKISFKPHWFVQAQLGVAHTIGEAKFSDLISSTAALNIGYKFVPVFGVRIGLSGWQAKGGWVNPEQSYKYKYLQGNLDGMLDLSTLFFGFNHKRVFNGYVFGGVALNRGFDNDEANALDIRSYQMEYLWQDGKILLTGRFGLGCDFRLNNYFSINLEVNANALSDKFNSKKAGNCDWQFNALVGVNINLGKSYTRTAPVYYTPAPTPIVVEQPQTVSVREEHKPQEQVVLVEPMQQNIFFALNSAKIQEDQKDKIKALVAYLKQHTLAKVCVTGYADVDTGNPFINSKLSEKRAHVVAETLKADGISKDRIKIDFKGDTEQPFSTPKENRVSICIAE